MSIPLNYFAGDGSVLQKNLYASIPTENLNDVIDVRAILQTKVLPAFNGMLLSALMMNTSYISTKYISDDMEQKRTDAEQKERLTRNEISKARYNYMQKQYNINNNNFIAGVLQGLLLVLGIVAILFCYQRLGKMPMTVACVLSALLVSIYLFIVVLLVRNNYQRRKDDWSKFYFAPYEPK